jgi:hypothetical protein
MDAISTCVTYEKAHHNVPHKKALKSVRAQKEDAYLFTCDNILHTIMIVSRVY